MNATTARRTAYIQFYGVFFSQMKNTRSLLDTLVKQDVISTEQISTGNSLELFPKFSVAHISSESDEHE